MTGRSRVLPSCHKSSMQHWILHACIQAATFPLTWIWFHRHGKVALSRVILYLYLFLYQFTGESSVMLHGPVQKKIVLAESMLRRASLVDYMTSSYLIATNLFAFRIKGNIKSEDRGKDPSFIPGDLIDSHEVLPYHDQGMGKRDIE